MGSIDIAKKPHAVCIPYPAQGHINPMLKLAKILHFRGFYITFVNTDYNDRRLLSSRGPDSVNGLPDFRFEAIPDGLPPSAIVDSTQHVPSLCDSTSKKCLIPFCDLLSKLNNAADVPPVTCIISDGVMSFTLDAAANFGLPDVLFWTTSACGFLAYTQYKYLVERCLTPLKDASYLSNGYLDTTIDWIPGMKNIRLRDLPSFIRTTDPDDVMINFAVNETDRASRATAIILNTFDALERDAIDSLSSFLPPILTIGPLQLMLNQVSDDDRFNSIDSNFWKEDRGCIEWLSSKQPNSVLYVNFGSVTVMTPHQLTEFAWGLANSKKDFLWIVRPDLIVGESAGLPPEFVVETKERGMLGSWCPQEEVLKHPAVAGFLTHSGWNSTMETVCGGVPVLCWPFFAEQPTNSWYSCTEWGIGLEIDSDVKREEVEKLVRELMEGEKGKDMKRKAVGWKKAAEEAVGTNGSSNVNLDKLIGEMLLPKNIPAV